MTRPNSIRANVSTAARQVGAAAEDSRELVAELRELVAVLNRIAVGIEKNGAKLSGEVAGIDIPASITVKPGEGVDQS
jgi:ABC-type phosphate transport system ATPase subunit